MDFTPNVRSLQRKSIPIRGRRRFKRHADGSLSRLGKKTF